MEFCAAQGLEFDYINENVPENVAKFNNDSRKIFAHEYFDDKGVNPIREQQWERAFTKTFILPIIYAVAGVLIAAVEVAAIYLIITR